MAQSQRPEEREEDKQSIREWLSISSGYISFILASVGLVSVVAGGILYLLIDEIQIFSFIVVLIGVGLLVLALLLSPGRVLQALIGRRGRYGTNTLIMTAAFLFIAGLVNFLFFDLIEWRNDVTATKQFSLAPQTLQVLENLEEPIKATAFFVLNIPDQEAAWINMGDLLNEYERRSKRKFDFKLIDPQEEPSTARQYEVIDFPIVVIESLESKRRQAVLTSIQSPALEQDLTAAILAVTGIKQKVVYFLEGHDERSAIDVEPEGYALVGRGLFSDNYAVAPLNLLQIGEVPSDATVLVIAGPKKDLLEGEAEAIDRYLVGGGRALFLLDPETPQTFRDIIANWAMVLGNGSIVDPGRSLATDTRTPLISPSQYLPFPITEVLESPSLFPGVTSVDIAIDPDDLPQGILFVPLAFTSEISWLEMDPESDSFDGDVDIPGPLLVASAVMANQPLREGAEPSADLTKLVVFGDSDFATNFFYSYNSNADFLLNSVNWLTEDVNLISIRPKPFAIRQLFITQRERNFIKWSSWLLIPGIVGMLGVVTWWRRR